jgi:tetratricopeptide (TPR) repeat protein
LFHEGEGFTEMVTTGEAFLHHVPTDGSSYRMPLAGVVLAWYNGHAPAWARAALRPLLWAGPVALAFELGCLLQGPPGGALAAALAALPWSANEVGLGEELLYKLLVGLAALLLAWKSSRPTWRRGAALGLAIGVSLLCRSPLFLFPPLLAAYDLIRPDPKRSLRSRLPGVAALLLCSYILLAPWTLMNWRLHGRFIPLEDGRADSDVATAAMGLAPNLSGNYRWLAGIPDGGRVLPWAARRVLRHPVPYLKGCSERLRFALRLHPLLWAAAIIVLGLNFRSEAFRQVALFCCYFAGVHCLLAIEKRYLEPLWVLLGSLSAAGAAGLIWRPEPRDRPGPLAWPYWAGAAAAGLATLVCISSYPGRPLPPAQVPVARALRRDPADAWLLHLYSRDLLRQGRAAAAVGSARRALELAPDQYPMLFTCVWALAASGRATQDWLDRITTGLDPGVADYPDKASAGYLLEAIWHLDAGRRQEAASSYEQALAWWQAQLPRLRPLEAPRDAAAAHRVRRIDAELVRLDTRLPDLVKGLLAAWPEPAREKLAYRLIAGSSQMRPKPLPGTPITSGETTKDLRGQARAAQERKDYWQALRILDRLVRGEPSDAKLRNDRGVVYALLGRRREAADEFAAALRLDPALASAYLSLGSLQAGLGRPREAARLYETALRKACPRLDAELCRLLAEPGPQTCFTRDQRVCGLIAQELDRLRR